MYRFASLMLHTALHRSGGHRKKLTQVPNSQLSQALCMMSHQQLHMKQPHDFLILEKIATHKKVILLSRFFTDTADQFAFEISLCFSLLTPTF